MIDIAGLGHANYRMDQQVCLEIACRSHRDFLVGTVHRIARLKRNNLAPTQLFKTVSEFTRCIAQMFEVIVGRHFDATQTAANIHRITYIFQIVNSWMYIIIAAIYALGFCIQIG